MRPMLVLFAIAAEWAAMLAAAQPPPIAPGLIVPESQRRALTRFPPIDEDALHAHFRVLHGYYDADRRKYVWHLAPRDALRPALVAELLDGQGRVLVSVPLRWQDDESGRSVIATVEGLPDESVLAAAAMLRLKPEGE